MCLEKQREIVVLLIVDEVSFIGRAFFHRMHCRLQQAKRAFFAERALALEQHHFGDISMILVGDFGQLEPTCISNKLRSMTATGPAVMVVDSAFAG